MSGYLYLDFGDLEAELEYECESGLMFWVQLPSYAQSGREDGGCCAER